MERCLSYQEKDLLANFVLDHYHGSILYAARALKIGDRTIRHLLYDIRPYSEELIDKVLGKIRAMMGSAEAA